MPVRTKRPWQMLHSLLKLVHTSRNEALASRGLVKSAIDFASFINY